MQRIDIDQRWSGDATAPIVKADPVIGLSSTDANGRYRRTRNTGDKARSHIGGNHDVGIDIKRREYGGSFYQPIPVGSNDIVDADPRIGRYCQRNPQATVGLTGVNPAVISLGKDRCR